MLVIENYIADSLNMEHLIEHLHYKKLEKSIFEVQISTILCILTFFFSLNINANT